MARLSRGLAVAVGVAAVAVWGRGVVRAEDRTQMSAERMGAAGQGVPTIQVYARETVVDVTVTDKDGKPVHGLRPSDFTVLEDGKAQAVKNFSETRRDAAGVSTATPTAMPKLPPYVYTNRQPDPATGASNILLLDTVNVEMGDQVYSRQEAAKYVRSMPPGTQVAVFRLGDPLRILQGFTSAPEVLIAAINDKKDSLLPPSSAIAPCVRPRLNLDALREIAAFLSGIKGRKNLIWFVGGPIALGDICDPTLERETFDMLAAAQVAVYPVDARGLVNPLATSAAEGPMNINGNTGQVAAAGAMYSEVKLGAQQLAYEALAERTGGVAYYNSRDVAGEIGRAIDNGANYYTLSYVPPGGSYDGRHHTIHVAVDRAGVQLVYRLGYGADDPKEALAKTSVPTKLASTTAEPEKNTMVASMARFAPVATQVVFDVKVAPTESKPAPADAAVMGFPVAELKGKPMARYDILYSVPAEEIALSDGTDGVYRGSLEFDVVASDVFGKLMTSASQGMPVVLTADEHAEFAQRPFQFFQQIDLPAGQTYVKVGIRDATSGKVGTVEVPVTVAKAGGVVRAGAK